MRKKARGLGDFTQDSPFVFIDSSVAAQNNKDSKTCVPLFSN
jgi:hypothetical protein